MAKVTWSTRVEEPQKIEIENRIDELLQANPDGDRGVLVLEGLKSLTDEHLAEQSSYSDSLKSGYAAIEQVKKIMQGLTASADSAEAVAEEKYLERIETLEEQNTANKAEAEKAKEDAAKAQETADAALKTQESSESALRDKTALTEQLQAEVIDLKERLAEATAQSASAQAESRAKDAAIDDLKSENAELKQANAVLATEQANALESKQEMKDRYTETRGDFEKATATNETLRKQIETLQKQLAS